MNEVDKIRQDILDSVYPEGGDHTPDMIEYSINQQRRTQLKSQLDTFESILRNNLVQLWSRRVKSVLEDLNEEREALKLAKEALSEQTVAEKE